MPKQLIKSDAISRLMQLSLALFGSILLMITLSGCVAVATQVASSILTHSADKIINDAYDAKLREEDRTRKLPDTHPEQYWLAMQNSGFSTITPQIENIPVMQADAPKILIEPLPISAELATVEVWSLVIGEEKLAIFENARIRGAAHLPAASDWKNWQVGLGEFMPDNSVENRSEISLKKPITFLIPPDFGRVNSGQQVVVELAPQGEVNIARYLVTEKTAALTK